MRANHWLIVVLMLGPSTLHAQEGKSPTSQEHEQKAGKKHERNERGEHQEKGEHRKVGEHEGKGEHQEAGETRKGGEHAGKGAEKLNPEQRHRALTVMATEIEKHRSRAARIKRLRVLAEEKGDKDRLKELARLNDKENGRHRAMLNRFEEKLGTSNYAKARASVLRRVEKGGAEEHGRELTPEERRRRQEDAKAKQGEKKSSEHRGEGEHGRKPAKGQAKTDDGKEG